MSVVVSTLPLPAAERAEYWHEAVSNTFIPLDVSLHEREPSAASITSHCLGSLQISVVRAGPQSVVRSRRLIARDGEEWITLTMQHRGTAVLDQDGREVLLRPGEFALSDSGRPFRKKLPEDFCFTAFHLPRAALGVLPQDLRALTATVFTGDSGCAVPVASYLTGLARGAGTFDAYVGRRLAATAADLLAVLIHERRGRMNPQALGTAGALPATIKDYIVRNLADPGLSPEGIAAAHRVSVRYLHKLFQGEETTVSRWIRQQRLERCRRELSRPAAVPPTVASVAQRWGFVSPSHFSRVFRAAYGMSPREWQANAGAVDGCGGRTVPGP
ncbi:AraC-like ligand-binding domain-containing protein [Streptomyces avermitilis]|uniref:AraC-like ligand-binding domain-containing protein n=1 Tax=Streptomyces avermitilis TaxID=33903 RepID=UPI0038108E2E